MDYSLNLVTYNCNSFASYLFQIQIMVIITMIYVYLKLFLFLMIAVVVTNTTAQTTRKKTITIASHLSFQNYEHFKRLVLKSPDSAVEYLEEFNFEWGYTYQIEVKETFS